MCFFANYLPNLNEIYFRIGFAKLFISMIIKYWQIICPVGAMYKTLLYVLWMKLIYYSFFQIKYNSKCVVDQLNMPMAFGNDMTTEIIE